MGVPGTWYGWISRKYLTRLNAKARWNTPDNMLGITRKTAGQQNIGLCSPLLRKRTVRLEGTQRDSKWNDRGDGVTFLWGETKKGWDSSAGVGKRKYDAGLQKQRRQKIKSHCHLPGHLLTCKLLLATSYNAGARVHMMEWTGAQFKRKKRKYLFTQRMWDLWDWLSWLAVWADSVGEGEGKFTNNSHVRRDWKHQAGLYPPMSPSYNCRPESDARKIIYFNF